MYHLRLIKALSYSGVVKATKDKPDAYTDDEAIAQKAVASGYFRLIGEESPAPAPETPGADDDPASQFTGGGDGDDDHGDDPDGEQHQEPQPEGGTNGSGKTLDEMNVSELETFATYKGVSLKGVKGKANIVAKLREELGEEATSGIIEYGSPTMVELQQE